MKKLTVSLMLSLCLLLALAGCQTATESLTISPEILCEGGDGVCEVPGKTPDLAKLPARQSGVAFTVNIYHSGARTSKPIEVSPLREPNVESNTVTPAVTP